MDMPTSALTGITLKDLFDAGLHFGHQTKRWNPKMKGYIFDKRNGIHIIDLTQSVQLLDEAAELVSPGTMSYDSPSRMISVPMIPAAEVPLLLNSTSSTLR